MLLAFFGRLGRICSFHWAWVRWSGHICGFHAAPTAPVSVPAILMNAPAVAPLSVEVVAAAVTAVTGIRETQAASSGQQPAPFVPATACSQPRQAGPCNQLSLRWYYDAATATCEEFAFGGCLVGCILVI